MKGENIHFPDKFFRLSSFNRGKQAYGRLYQTLGTMDLD